MFMHVIYEDYHIVMIIIIIIIIDINVGTMRMNGGNLNIIALTLKFIFFCRLLNLMSLYLMKHSILLQPMKQFITKQLKILLNQ